MIKTLFPLVLLCFGANSFAQQDFFGLVGKNTPNIVFNDFRALDPERGVSGEIFLNADSKPNIFSQVQNRNVAEEKTGYNHAQASAMATLAFDGKNSLVYMPMYSSNIYAINTKTKEITLVESNVVKTSACDLGSHFTRMTLASDGKIYALTNSGSQLLQISKTGSGFSVQDLGKISDDAGNGEMLISKINTGYGGDMVADSNKNLYVFSASGNVFKISLADKKALFIGKLKGLPEKYTLNGSAVNVKGEVLVASANGNGFYKVDLQNLQAEPLNQNQNLHIYDLASSYLLSEKQIAGAVSKNTDVYPTNVTQGFTNVYFGENLKQQVSVEILDAAGNRIDQKLYLAEPNTLQQIDLSKLSTGWYLININNVEGKNLLTKKIIVN